MKKIISLTVVLALLCTMAVIPVASADTTAKSAYEWLSVVDLSGSANADGDLIATANSYGIDGTTTKPYVAKAPTHKGRIHFAQLDFGTKAPTSFMMTVLTPVKKDTTIKIYAFPVGTVINTVASGVVTSFTLPDSETASADASGYIIGDFNRVGGQYNTYDLESGAEPLTDYEIKLDTSKTQKLIDNSEASNPWCIVITGISGLPALSRVKFKNDATLDAYTYQSAYLNNSDYANISLSEGVFGTNTSTKDVEYYIDFENVSFDTEEEGTSALAVHYAKAASLYAGDLSIEIDKNRDGAFDIASEQIALITPVATSKNAINTSHYVLLDEEIDGTYDMRIRFTNRYMARVFGFEFHKVNPETDVYGDVTATDNGDDTYTIAVPVNKNYIKGTNKYIVVIYNVDAENKPTTVSKIVDPVDFTVVTNARTDFGWDDTLATVTLPKSDLEGKYIKALLWKDFASLVPLTPVSSVVVAAQ